MEIQKFFDINKNLRKSKHINKKTNLVKYY